MPVLKFRSSIAAVILIFFLGCQHAAIAYRLRRDGLDPVLLPPTTADSTLPSFSVTVKHARHESPKAMNCDIIGDLISLRWATSDAQISFQSQSFFAPADQSPNQVGRGMYVDPLLALDQFRSALFERQSQGCLSAGENERLRRAIVEYLPLPPTIAYFLQLGSYDVTGYFDLTSDFRIQITSPIYAPGAQPSPSALVGYETANYTFRPDGTRTRMQLDGAIETPIEGPPIAKQTVRNELGFSNHPSYFRLLFMTEEGASRRVSRAILLSSPDQISLTQAVSHRGVSANEFCATLPTSRVNCTLFPKNFGVSPELRVRLNHKDAFVRVGGMVQEVLDLEGPDPGPPTSLRILRPFRGHLIPIQFDSSSKDVLKLVLLPGDELTY